MFIVVLHIRAKKCKQLKCLLPDKWINKCGIHAQVKYYIVTQKNEILLHAVT